MRKTYVIRWTSKVNGSIGQGSRLFDRDEANALASELNEEFPDIQHEVIEAPKEGAHAGGGEKKSEAALAE